MHITHFCSEYPPQPVFGLGRYVEEMARSQVAEGHIIEIFTNSLGGTDHEVIQNGVYVKRVHFPPPPKAPASSAMLLHFNLQLMERCWETYRNSTKKPDVIVAHDWLTFSVSYHCARALQVPLVIVLHDVIFNKVKDREFNPEDEYVAGIERWACQTASQIVVLSNTVRDEIVSHYSAPAERVSVIPGGVGIEPPRESDLSRLEQWRRKICPDNTDLVLYAGRLDAEKGISVLLNAVHELRGEYKSPWKLVIAGTGLLENWLDEFIVKHGLRDQIVRAGYLPFDELRTAYAASDIVVIPSEYEPFGLVALEAQRMGTPVIVSNTGGLAETLGVTRGGLKFESGDPKALAKCLQTLLKNRVFREELGKTGQEQVAKHFSWRSISGKLTEVLQKASISLPVDTLNLPPLSFPNSNTLAQPSAKEPLSDITVFLDGGLGNEVSTMLSDIARSHSLQILGGTVSVIQVRTGTKPLQRLPAIDRVKVVVAESLDQINECLAEAAACVVPVELAEGLISSGILNPGERPCIWLGPFQNRCGVGVDVHKPHELRAAVDRLLCDERFRHLLAPSVLRNIPQVDVPVGRIGKPIVLHLVPQFVTGGAETTLLEIVKGTRGEFSHALISFGRVEGPLPDELLALGAPILEAASLTDAQVINKIQQLAPTILHIHGCGYVPAWLRLHRQFSNTRIIETEHVVNIGAGMFGPVDRVVCVSESARSAHAPFLFLDSHFPERLQVIYNGINPKDYSDLPTSENAKRALGLPQGRPIIGRVSAIARNKFPQNALKSFKEILNRLPEALFVIVGDGEERSKIAQESERLGLKQSIIFLGERRDIPQVLRAFDIFAYYTEKDALGNVILEAVAAGVPVVTTRVEGTPEALGDAPGECVELENHVGFAQAVEKWYRIIQRKGVQKYELPSKFTRSTMAAEYGRIYSELRHKKASSPNKSEVPIERARILIKFPTRGRRERFFATLQGYQDHLSGQHDIQFVVSCDDDDGEMNNTEVSDRIGTFPNVAIHFSPNHSKVEAINADLNQYKDSFDILLLASDDMIPEVAGYDDIIARRMAEFFPNKDGALFFNDGFRGRELNTLVVIGSAYYRRFDFIYNPAYTSLWCDNEFTDVARILGRAVYSEQILVRHAHPANLGEPYDPLYQRNDQFFKLDKSIYEKRRSGAFGLTRRTVLSILIVTLESRSAQFKSLHNELQRQIQSSYLTESIEVLFESDSGQATIGEKRNVLMQRASGEYLCFIDDDDAVAPDYVERLFEALADGSPDCVGFSGQLVGPEGTIPKRFIHSLEYNDYSEVNNVYLRPPNHLNPIRRDIALQFPFKEVNKEEDLDYAMRIARDGALRKQRYVSKNLYFYMPSIFQRGSTVEKGGKKERVLFVLLFRLGDVLCGREIFARIRKMRPHAHLAWVTLPQYSCLVPSCADEVIEYGGGESIFTLKMPEWANQWDKVYDVQPGWHLEEWDKTKLPLVSFIAHLAGIDTFKARLSLPKTPTMENVAHARVADLSEYIVINAGPHVSGPNWDIAQRQNLADHLREKGWNVVALAGPDGVHLQRCRNVFDLNYFESAALIERARMYIGQDCGTSWLACTTPAPKLLLVDQSNNRKGYDSYVDCLENTEIKEVPLSITTQALLDVVLTFLDSTAESEVAPTLADALGRLIRSRKLKHIIETGTYEGEGTTRAIATALKELNSSDAKLISIEVNPKFVNLTRSNTQKRGLAAYAEVLQGLSLPRTLLPDEVTIERELQEILKEKSTLYVDHDVASRSRHYFGESNYESQDDLLRIAFERFEGKPELILLDSAGHLGFAEFEYIIGLLSAPCLVALDDTNHVKHYRSYKKMKQDSRFKIIAQGDSSFGYCIAEFVPRAVLSGVH